MEESDCEHVVPIVIWNEPAAPPCDDDCCEKAEECCDAGGDDQVVEDIVGIWQRSGVTAGGADPKAFAAALRRLQAKQTPPLPEPVAIAEVAEDQEQGLHCVNALRGGATELEGLADRFERYGLYERADALRVQAQWLRLDARRILHGGSPAGPTPMGLPALPSVPPSSSKKLIETSRFNATETPQSGEARIPAKTKRRY
ncbi:MAG: hypothetical protein WD176_08890 [Pirellulales bacterium]